MMQLFRIAGFLPYVAMVFLNAFVDLGHKIIIQNTLFKAYDGDTQIILTAIVNSLILLPFVLLFTPSGYLADKFPKDTVMRVSAWAAVLLGFSSVTQDIVIDAYRIESADEDLQAMLSATYIAGYRIGMLVAGGIVVTAWFARQWLLVSAQATPISPTITASSSKCTS